ncbi:MAG: beta-mannosidase [Lachnospiraceae bacterium]|nr:beta-mannosidase [Candidatus Colinaster scatohippi]
MRPVNANATAEAVKLLDYLYDVRGKGIITAQHTQTIPCEEIEYIKEQTGKEPKMRGFEMLAYSPNINYADASEACLTEVYENRDTMEIARNWAKSTDGIVTLSFHWFSPLGGRDKAFYAEHTDFDPCQVFVEGTAERKAFYSDMDRIAEELRLFYNDNIPVLWRPFHESDGTWFWWGRKGPAVAKELYLLMYDYYVNVKHLDNLLWVWNCRTKDGYPGDDYVDVISVDVYLEKYEDTDYASFYKELLANTSDKKVAALAEVGYIPDIRTLEKTKVPWAYYMSWSKEWIVGEQYNTVKKLKEMYLSDYSIKL